MGISVWLPKHCNILQHLPQKFSSWLVQCTAQEDPAFLAGTCGSIQGDRSWPASRVLHTKENHEGFSFFPKLEPSACCELHWFVVGLSMCFFRLLWLVAVFANVAVSVPFPVPTPVVDDEHVEDVVVGCCPCLRLRLQVLLLVLLWLYCFWDSPGHGGNQCGKQDMKRAEENEGWERLVEARQWVEVDCFYSSKILRRQELLKLLWVDDE